MDAGRFKDWRRAARRLLAGTAVAAGALAATAATASAATTATFSAGVLTVSGDNLNNNITISRNAAGTILVNGGAVSVAGGTPSVANTSLIRVLGLDGQDTITLNQAAGTATYSIQRHVAVLTAILGEFRLVAPRAAHG